MADLSPTNFRDFFQAIHGSPPFPWQDRLLAHVHETKQWPQLLDLPTGTGKTAALDVALFQLALEASAGVERTAPLRIVMVVDRRTIVDQAYLRAEKIRKSLLHSDDPVVVAVADGLRSLCGLQERDKSPLAITQLRGGMPRDDAWAHHPDQPLIAASTVDQVGSRLLFRGYGVSNSMRPIHAGLLGQDTLILLDEVHLSHPFLETLSALGNYRSRTLSRLPDRWQVVAMSATARKSKHVAFTLNESDRRNPILSRRLAAKKPTTLTTVAVTGSEADRRKKFARAIAERTQTNLSSGRTIGIVVNRVATARDIATILAELCGEDAEVVLVTGRMRPLDRVDINRKLQAAVGSEARSKGELHRPIIVVATQTIEAGADYDFDVLITECASLDSLRQRFGRLNRIGNTDTARGEILVRSDSLSGTADDPIYGIALKETWNWLNSKGSLDFGINTFDLPEDEELARLVPVPTRAPVLLPAHMDSWVQTSPIPDPDPDPSLWLHGVDRRETPEVQVVWRVELTQDLLDLAFDENHDLKRRAIESATNRIEACPPSPLEALSLPLPAVRRWLLGASEAELADVEGRSINAEMKEGSASGRPFFLYQGEASTVDVAKNLRPGGTIVVPVSYGGIELSNWNPGASSTVVDLGTRARLIQTKRPFLRLLPDLVQSISSHPPPGPHGSEEKEQDVRTEVSDWLKTAVKSPMDADLTETVALLEHEGRRSIVAIEEVPYTSAKGHPETIPGYLVLIGRTARGGDINTEEDTGSFTGVKVPLRRHLAGVGSRARAYAERCGLPADVVDAIATAGHWHDAGKADPRFQRLLNEGSAFLTAVANEPLAKSGTTARDRRAHHFARERSGYPEGARHELASVELLARYVESGPSIAPNDLDLIMYLVSSHHGYCRPFAPVSVDASPVEIHFHDRDASIDVRNSSDHGLARLDSGVPARFWRLIERYGWFGLAWMESILRLADHRQSEAEQRGEEGTGS